MNTSPMGLYLHIPFCKTKCHYCDFYTVKSTQENREAFVKALIRHIHQWGAITSHPIDTIYFGGGTPTLLSPSQLTQIFTALRSSFSIHPHCEITMESNPENLTAPLAAHLVEQGVNRISIGVQSLHQNTLSILGRSHGAEQVSLAISHAKQAGCTNISGDIILGTPGETLEQVSTSLQQLAELQVTHISLYQLKIEEGTKFYQQNLQLSSDHMADAYLASVAQLASLGYELYELSNFAKSGFSSKHNLKYWTNQPYLGIGPSAHSLYRQRRFFYEKKFFPFLEEPKFATLALEEGFDPLDELIFGLRLTQGLSLAKISHLLPKFSKKKIDNLVHNQLVTLTPTHLSLTPKGFLISNQILLFLLEMQ